MLIYSTVAKSIESSFGGLLDLSKQKLRFEKGGSGPLTKCEEGFGKLGRAKENLPIQQYKRYIHVCHDTKRVSFPMDHGLSCRVKAYGLEWLF